MALSVRVGDSEHMIDWHVGQPKPIAFWNTKNVVEVQADGHELEQILDTCIGIPVAMRSINGVLGVPLTGHKRVQRWFGDHAKFIVGTL